MPTVAELFDQLIDQLADDVAEKVMPQLEKRIEEVVAGQKPVEPEQPVPVDPTPEPEPELPVAAQFTFVDNDKDEWRNGVSTTQTRLFLKDTPEARKQVTAGRALRFADGQVRTVIEAKPIYNNILVTVDGEKLIDPALGHPNTVSVSGDAEPADPEGELSQPVVKPEPIPGKRKGMMGTAIGMGMGKPEVVPGELGHDFQIATEDDVIRARSYGFEIGRVGSLWERIIKPGGKHELYLGVDGKGKSYSLPKIMEFCRIANKHGLKVMPDLFHNYGGRSETSNALKTGPGHRKVGMPGGPTYDQFAYDYKAIIEYMQTDPECWDAIYGLDIMNEWVGLPSENVFKATQRFLDVCAPIMGDKMVVVEGNAYSNTPNFWTHNPQFKDLKDPRGPGFIEVSGHLYVDQDMSGSYKTGDTVKESENVTHEDVFIKRVKPFLDGAEKYGFHASIGEWVVPGDFPRLLEGSRRGIEYALSRGCNVIAFGMGRGYSAKASNHWNIEIPRNKPTLEMIKQLAGVAA